LPEAIEAVIRAPIITARSLAKRLSVTHQAALGLLKQLVEADIIKEATGRSAWRAFVTK
jgi:predicted transcriptional regulator